MILSHRSMSGAVWITTLVGTGIMICAKTGLVSMWGLWSLAVCCCFWQYIYLKSVVLVLLTLTGLFGISLLIKHSDRSDSRFQNAGSKPLQPESLQEPTLAVVVTFIMGLALLSGIHIALISEAYPEPTMFQRAERGMDLQNRPHQSLNLAEEGIVYLTLLLLVLIIVFILGNARPNAKPQPQSSAAKLSN